MEEVKSLRRELTEFKESAKQAQDAHEIILSSLDKKIKSLFEILFYKNTSISSTESKSSQILLTKESLIGEFPIRHTFEEGGTQLNANLAEIRSCFVVLDPNEVSNYMNKSVDNSDNDSSDFSGDDHLFDSEIKKRKPWMPGKNQIPKSFFRNPFKLSGKEFDRRIRALRKADKIYCKKYLGKSIETLPENYFEHGAINGKTLQQIRQKFTKDRYMNSQDPNLRKNSLFKTNIKNEKCKSSPLTGKEYERRLKELQEEDKEYCEENPEEIPLPEFYLKFAATSRKTLEQARIKFRYSVLYHLYVIPKQKMPADELSSPAFRENLKCHKQTLKQYERNYKR